MTPPKTKPVHANKADSGNSPCTCGHHITGALHGSDIHNNEETRTKDDDGSTPHSAILDSTTTPSSLLMALPDGQTETNSSSQASANTAQFAPLDASFVQIPSSFHVSADCSSNNERSQSRRPPPQQPQQQFFHGASIPTATPKEASHSISGDAMNYSSKSADFLRGLSRLHKAATFIASPPSLCVGCVQRYEFVFILNPSLRWLQLHSLSYLTVPLLLVHQKSVVLLSKKS